MKWLFLIILFYTLSSCIELQQSEYIKEIDTSIHLLDEAKEKMDNSVFDSIPTVLSEINFVKTKVRDFLKNDTLPLDYAIKIDQLNETETTLKKIEKEIPVLINDIETLSENLNNLKNDINNSSGIRAKYSDNIEIETKNQTLLVEAAMRYYEDCSNSIKSFYEIEPELKLFSNKLELKNKEQKLIP